jgi:hypothetical protein
MLLCIQLTTSHATIHMQQAAPINKSGWCTFTTLLVSVSLREQNHSTCGWRSDKTSHRNDSLWTTTTVKLFGASVRIGLWWRRSRKQGTVTQKLGDTKCSSLAEEAVQNPIKTIIITLKITCSTRTTHPLTSSSSSGVYTLLSLCLFMHKVTKTYGQVEVYNTTQFFYLGTTRRLLVSLTTSDWVKSW